MKLESREKGQHKIKPGRRVKHRVLGVGQKRLAVSVAICPESEVSFLEELRAELPRRYFNEGEVAFVERPRREEKIAEEEEKERQEKNEQNTIRQVFFIVYGEISYLISHGRIVLLRIWISAVS